MSDHSPSLKSFLLERQQEIALAHTRGASGFATAVALTAMMDEAIAGAFQSVSSGMTRQGKDQVAILALGAYARVELCPKSDVDVMVLCGDGVEKHDAEELARQFLHVLWDGGMDVGHSVRTVADSLALHGDSLDAWASLLESRLVCGSVSIAAEFFEALRSRGTSEPDRWFIEGMLADLDARHERYGNSVKLLEPNIKKSAGGLRDYHSLFWLFRATDPSWLAPLRNDHPAAEDFLLRLHRELIIDDAECESALNALRFLLRTRAEMHYLRQSLHDTLEYALQGEVAEGLGYGSRAATQSVEAFMREYYLHARVLYRLHVRLCQKFRDMIAPPRPAAGGGQRFGPFTVRDETLTMEEGGTVITLGQVFEAFALASEHGALIEPRLKTLLERAGESLGEAERSSHELSARFKRILATRNVAQTLRTMNELGILGRYIPEFGELVAFFQHNVYHYFTADEHTIIAVAKAEEIREQQGILREVFRNVRRRDTLYMAILLHDIAKPRGVADHEITGVEMARVILHRLHMDDLFPGVAFLIRNHLVMEQVAFRRNIHDPETIREFADMFERPEQLDYLYLLTYADLSAVNINVWTEWKGLLLQDLYRQTAAVLRRNLKGEEIDLYHKSRREASVQELVDRLGGAMPREHVQKHLDGIRGDSYLSLFTEEEIGRHIHTSMLEEPVSTIFAHRDGFTELTVIAEDAPFALAKFCAVLAANDASILDATIFTRDDGVIIDRFRLSDATTHRELDHRVCAKITSDLMDVVQGTLDIGNLFQAHRRKWKRRPKLPPNPNVRQDVEFEDNPKYTIIDVYAPDALGLLYRITETISRLGLDIHFAKIATRMDGIVDAFYTLERDGGPVSDPDRRDVVRLEILKTIKAMGEQELA